MAGVTFYTGEQKSVVRPARWQSAPLPMEYGAQGAVTAELCSALFASLPRIDQRRKGAQYIDGLLRTRGRKSIRNIAALIGGQATEQSLHHFIASSTWDWVPVRRALTRYLLRTAPAQAWVVRPIVIPKAGEQSIGVERRFVPGLGQILNAQRAVGVWSASEEMSHPLNWRLHLPQEWLDSVPGQRQGPACDDSDTEALDDSALAALAEMSSGWSLPARPVVMDARDSDAAKLIWRLRASGNQHLVRINSTLPLTLADTSLAGHRGDALPGHHIIGASRDLRRPVTWVDHSRDGILRTSLVATVRVRLPSRSPRPDGTAQHSRRRDLLLLGAALPGQGWPAELWLTDLVDVAPGALFRLSRLIDRVDRDQTGITDQVGIKDYAGRSYNGWHRHATLASAAHAVAALTAAPRPALARLG